MNGALNTHKRISVAVASPGSRKHCSATAQTEGRGWESCEVQPRARSPPRNGANARGRSGDGSAGRRGGTLADRPSLRSPGRTRAKKPDTSSTQCRRGAIRPGPRIHQIVQRCPQPPNKRAVAAAPEAGAVDVRLTSDVTLRRGGSQDGAGGRFRSTRRAWAADVGLRCARSPARGPGGGHQLQVAAACSGEGETCGAYASWRGS